MTKRASTLVLILANMVPLLGVVLWQWDVMSILLLYWAENVVIGLLNVARMASSASGNLLQGVLQMANGRVPDEVRRQMNEQLHQQMSQQMPRLSMNALKFFLIPFFIVHYGAFCLGHLTFILAIFSEGGINLRSASELTGLLEGTFWVAIAAILVSHLFSFFSNYIGKGEYKNASLFLLIHRPYGRIISMHVAIVLGAGLVMYLNDPLPMLLILIVMKTALDVRLHEKERSKLGAIPHSTA